MTLWVVKLGTSLLRGDTATVKRLCRSIARPTTR